MVQEVNSKPKSYAVNTTWSVSATILGIAITFFLTPFIIRVIGEDHYGLYILLMSIAGMMGIVNMGLGEATLRYVSFYYSRNDVSSINRVVGSTLLIYVLAGLIAGSFLYFFAGKITGWINISPTDYELSVSIIRLTALNFFLSFVISVYSSIPQALLRFDISSKVAIFQNIIQVFGTVVFLLRGYGLYHIVLWSVITAVLTQVVNMRIAKRLLPSLTMVPVISKCGLKEIFGYGIYSSMNVIISILSAHIDRILLAVFVNPAAVAALSVPRQILDKGGSLLQSAGAVIFPKISSMSDTKSIRRVFQISSWGLLTFSMALFSPGIVLFPKFLSVWISPEFARSSGFVAQLLSAAYAFRGISEPYFSALRGTNNIKKLTIILSSTSLIGVFAAIPLLYYLGLNGAGYRSIILVWLSIPISLWVNAVILKGRRTRSYLSLLMTPVYSTILIIGSALVIDRMITYNSLLYVFFAWFCLSGTIVLVAYLLKRRFVKNSDLNLTIIDDFKYNFKTLLKKR